MTGRTIGSIVVILIIIAAAWYFLAGPASSPTVETPVGTQSATPETGPVTVTYTDQGFSPASLTVAEGTTVTFVNQSSEDLWFASDPHPAHTAYDGTSRSQHCAAGYAGAAPLDSCKALKAGESFSFVFDKAGTWGFHNHSHDEMRGTVYVVAPSTSGVTASTSVNVTLP